MKLKSHRKFVLAVVSVLLGISGTSSGSDEGFGSSVSLSGRTLFLGYLSDSGFIFSPEDYNVCPATATLTRTGKKKYTLELYECNGFRLSVWTLAITGHGGAKVDAEEEYEEASHQRRSGNDTTRDDRQRGWDLLSTDATETNWVFPPPETGSIVGQVALHTGCSLNGTFPAYQGTWDGRTLYLATVFQSPSCGGGTLWGTSEFWAGVDDPDGHLVDGLTRDDGAVHVRFSIDMFVID